MSYAVVNTDIIIIISMYITILRLNRFESFNKHIIHSEHKTSEHNRNSVMIRSTS